MHSAQLVLSEVGGQGFPGTGAVAALKVSSLCLAATDVPHSGSKLGLHALMAR